MRTPLRRSTRRRCSRRRSTRAVAAVALMVSLAVTGTSTSADGATPTATANTTAAGTTAAGTPSSSSSTASAAAQAAQSGEPVTIDADTTASSTTSALPDGMLQTTYTATPVRVQQNGAWVPLDSDLVASPDGRYTTTATSSALSISGGGSGPLASMTNGDTSLSITWPTPLPAPTISGTSATYANVLAGVDLKITTNLSGGFSDVLIVTNAVAAANPALAHISTTLAISGLSVQSDSGGNISAVDNSGTTIFHAPAPQMWDSSTAATSSPATSTPVTSAPSDVAGSAAPTSPAATSAAITPTVATGSAAPAAASTAPATSPSNTATAADGGTGDPDDPSTAPPQGSTVDPVQVSTSNSSLTLTPDQTLLTSPSTDYPVYIDPTWESVATAGVSSSSWQSLNKSVSDYDWTQQAYPKTSWWDSTSNGDPAVGYQGWTNDGSEGENTSYFQFNIGTQYDSDSIQSAKFTTQSNYSGSFDCSASYTVSEANVTPISTATTWSNPPNTIGQGQDQTVHDVYPPNGCTAYTVIYNDVTSAVANDGDGILTFRLEAKNETDKDSYGRFNPSQTSLTVVYDTPPQIPSHLGVGIVSQASPPATCSSPGPWLDNLSQYSLSAQVYDQDQPSQSVEAKFNVWDYGLNNTQQNFVIGTGDPNSVSQATTTRNGVVGISLGTGGLSGHYTGVFNGHYYQYDAIAYDGIDTSAESAHCYFRYDNSAPSTPSTTTSTPAHVILGNPITVTVTSTDPIPANGTSANASGIGYFAYSTISDSDLDNNGGTHVAAQSSGGTSATGTITFTPGQWGETYLYVRAVDAAGNASADITIPIYVADNGTADIPGDVDGDGHPDILLTTNNNPALQMIHPDQPPLTLSTVSSGSQSPNGTTWNGVLFTHRSAVDNDLDDLYAYQAAFTNASNTPIAANLYYYHNTGTPGGEYTTFSTVQFQAGATATGFDTTWNGVTQLLAPGDVNGDTYPDLYVVQNGQLWFIPGTSYPSVLGIPQRITATLTQADLTNASSDNAPNVNWNDWRLMAPGDDTGAETTGYNPTGQACTTGASNPCASFYTPDLWIADGNGKQNGELIQFAAHLNANGTIYLDPGNGPTASGFTPTTRPLLTSPGQLDTTNTQTETRPYVIAILTNGTATPSLVSNQSTALANTFQITNQNTIDDGNNSINWNTITEMS